MHKVPVVFFMHRSLLVKISQKSFYFDCVYYELPLIIGNGIDRPNIWHFISPAKRRSANHPCPVCGKFYVNEGSLRKHLACHPEMTSQLSSSLRMWPCSVCTAVFTHENGKSSVFNRALVRKVLRGSLNPSILRLYRCWTCYFWHTFICYITYLVLFIESWC